MPMIKSNQNSSNLFLLFSIVWCLSALIHQLIWPEWTYQKSPIDWLLSVFCVGHIMTLGRYIGLFILAVFTSAFWFVLRQPLVVNHLYFETIMSIIMSAVIMCYYINIKFRQKSYQLSSYFVANAIPLLRLCILILYFFAVFHKLNYDYFNTDLSCGAVLFENLLNNVGITKIDFVEDFYTTNQIAIAQFSIYFSLIAEFTIPLLILLKQTRNIGIIMGLLFHFILGLEGLGGIVSFSAMMFTYLISFSSDEVIAKALEVFSKYRIYIITGFSIAMICIAFSYHYSSENVYNKTVGTVWFIYSLLTIGFYTKYVKYTTELKLNLLPRTILYLVFPLIVFLNGISPYIGLKTQTVFSMFSNLKTENGKTNHILIPNMYQIFNYQNEIVEIVDTNMEYLSPPDTWNKDKAYNYLLFEFIKKLNTIEEGQVTFKVNDTTHYIEKRNDSIISSTIDLNQNLILTKILLFRPIYSDDVSYCQQ